jgi:hypothetical protein
MKTKGICHKPFMDCSLVIQSSSHNGFVALKADEYILKRRKRLYSCYFVRTNIGQGRVSSIINCSSKELSRLKASQKLGESHCSRRKPIVLGESPLG